MTQPWIQSHTGKAVWPFNIKHDQICLEDIIHSLSYLCRFNGHTKIFYSVADHSLHVSELLKNESPFCQLLGLMHDVAEAYLGDLAAPLKGSARFQNDNGIDYDWVFLEQVMQIKIIFAMTGKNAGGRSLAWKTVEEADLMMLAWEKRDLLAVDMDWGWKLPEPPEQILVPRPADDVRQMFLDKFHELKALL